MGLMHIGTCTFLWQHVPQVCTLGHFERQNEKGNEVRAYQNAWYNAAPPSLCGSHASCCGGPPDVRVGGQEEGPAGPPLTHEQQQAQVHEHLHEGKHEERRRRAHHLADTPTGSHRRKEYLYTQQPSALVDVATLRCCLALLKQLKPVGHTVTIRKC